MGGKPNEYGAWRDKKGKKNGAKMRKRAGGTAEKSDFPVGSGTQIGGDNPFTTHISQPNTLITSSAPYCYE